MAIDINIPSSIEKDETNAVGFTAGKPLISDGTKITEGEFTPNTSNQYFVASDGLDTNDGLTPTTPFLTLAKVATKITSNTVVNIKNGSIFRESLIIPPGANNVTIQSYGSSANPLPIIDCSDIIPNSDFSLSGGYTKVYQCSKTIGGTTTSWVNVFENDSFLTNVSSLALCESTAGSYYVPTMDANGVGSTSVTIYIHPTADGNPITNGKIYEFSKRPYSIDGDNEDFLTIKNLVCKKNLSHNGSIITGKNAHLYNITCMQGGKHNLLTRRNSYHEKVTGYNAYFGINSLTLFVTYEDIAGGTSVRYVDCIAKSDTPITLSSGFLLHNSTSGTFGIVTFDRCKVINCGAGFNVGASDLVIENDCIASVSGVAHYSSCNAIINRPDYTSSTSQGLFVPTVANVYTKIFDAIRLETTFGAGHILFSTTNNIVFELYNSVITKSAGWAFQATGNNVTMISLGNQFITTLIGIYDFAGSGLVLTSNFNYFSNPLADNRIAGTTYADIPSFVKALQKDTRSDYANQQAYTTSNVTTLRTMDASSITLPNLASVVGTLMDDLKKQGVIK